MSNILEDMQSAVVAEAAAGGIAKSRRDIDVHRVYAIQGLAGASVVTALMLFNIGPTVWVFAAMLPPAMLSLIVEGRLIGNGKRDGQGGAAYTLTHLLGALCTHALVAKLAGWRWAAMGWWWAAFCAAIPIFAIAAGCGLLIQAAIGGWALVAIGVGAARVRALTVLSRAVDAQGNQETGGAS